MGYGKVVALSGSSKETAAYGRAIGKRLRHIANKDTMKSESFGVTEIHYLPGWNKRRDRHAVAAVVTRIRRARRRETLIERFIVRQQDGSYVEQNPEVPEAADVGATQKTQLDGLRQMNAPVAHIPQTISAEEVAEETGTDVDTDEFLDFLDNS